MSGAGIALPAGLRRQLAEVFADALERPPAERAAFLDSACVELPALRAEVESLLAAHAADDGFLACDDTRWRAPAPAEPPVDAGDRLGPYRVLRELGHGGMGVVYLAERADGAFEQRVAVKVLRDATQPAVLLRRFARERHILARLDHPNIARLLDAGATTDARQRSYLAMEYVEGVPITEYSDARRLDVAQRIALFADACAAVEYAHRSLVVHRDLKPGNILVTSAGRVKLLDFGIAKLLEAESDDGARTLTETGFRALTPEYAAPEQIRGEPVTTSADVYALGAVLYELLTGSRPYRFGGRSLVAMAQLVAHEDPLLPSVAATRRDIAAGPQRTPEAIAAARATTPERLRRRLAGDLDAILLTALQRDSERRYASAEALREDLRRHAAGVPISARRHTSLYRAGRFVRRNRAVVATGMLTFATLAAGLAATAWQARTAARERDVALHEADKAARASAFMSRLFGLADPNDAGSAQVTMREALDSGRVWVARELATQPELRAELETDLGEVYYGLGLYTHARDLWAAALNTRLALGGESQPDVLETRLLLAKAFQNLGRNDAAEAQARRSLALLADGARTDAAFVTTHVLDRLANSVRLQGRLDEAETLVRRALAQLPAGHRDAPHRRTVLQTTLAHVLRARGDAAGAERLYTAVLAQRRVIWGEQHPEVANALVNLAGAFADQRRFDEAEALFRQGLDMRRRLQGDAHPEVGVDLAGLAELQRARGDAVAAVATFREALARQQRALPGEHPVIATTLLGLGRALTDQGNRAEAEPLLRRAHALRRSTFGAAHAKTAEVERALRALRPPS